MTMNDAPHNQPRIWRSDDPTHTDSNGDAPVPPAAPSPATNHTEQPEEIGGPQGPEPTRYGDWERKGRCVDF